MHLESCGHHGAANLTTSFLFDLMKPRSRLFYLSMSTPYNGLILKVKCSLQLAILLITQSCDVPHVMSDHDLVFLLHKYLVALGFVDASDGNAILRPLDSKLLHGLR